MMNGKEYLKSLRDNHVVCLNGENLDSWKVESRLTGE
ncbi:hypothetical protein B0I26_12719 [Anoxybacillus vitaminiphilus]|uniref:Uncharacterized protein n=1 Tax=Paranoxybacillus vitaminiphilus TaxID=581036 RepID=A0A327Y3P1_9BACL|nr:hypothetical protein B0I26_12719 [Anoxybacillus vitaminiphilus]